MGEVIRPNKNTYKEDYSMKMNRTMRVAVLMLALTIITSCFVGGTFAKYTSTTTGSSTATVAKWSFKVNNAEFAVQPEATLTFNLFDTINDTGNTTDEGDVADGRIAPGTAGSFDMIIANTSEVNATWTVVLEETNGTDIPLQYSVDGTTWTDSVAELVMTDLTGQSLDMNKSTTVTVYWRWVFDDNTDGAHAKQNDRSDTALGIYAQNNDTVPTVTITATLTATQVD